MSTLINSSSKSTQLSNLLIKCISTYNNTLIDEYELNLHLKLSKPRTWITKHRDPPQSLLGVFAKFPRELILYLLSVLDIDSIMRLRATNSVFRALIESWQPFRVTMSDAKMGVKALIATKASRLWTFVDLLQVTYTSRCELCGAHGEILHLLQLKRVCFRCLTVDRSLLVVSGGYAYTQMNLVRSDMRCLPYIQNIPQNSVFGSRSYLVMRLFNYQSALNLAIEKHRSNTKQIPFRGPRISRFPTETNPTSIPQSSMFSCAFCQANQFPRVPLHTRRALKHDKTGVSEHPHNALYRLPSFLLNPPESEYHQHRASVYFPARTPPTNQGPSTIISASLCAGCSFYFNYHTSLPHQAQTLYPHPSSNLEETYSTTHTSPLTTHINECIYTKLYLNTHLYPLHLSTSPGSKNPLLETNGGMFTWEAVRGIRETYHAMLSTWHASQHRHFARHPFHMNSIAPLRKSQNNEIFEMLPFKAIEALEENEDKPLDLPQETDLELEITAKLGLETHDDRDKAAIELQDLLSPESDWDDSRFDAWTRKRLADLRFQQTQQQQRQQEDPHPAPEPHQLLTADAYGDFLLQGTDETVSQASWATARTSSSTTLFRGWMGLLLERRAREEEAWMASEHDGSEGLGEWGFDRFGCVSHLG